MLTYGLRRSPILAHFQNMAKTLQRRSAAHGRSKSLTLENRLSRQHHEEIINVGRTFPNVRTHLDFYP